MVEQTKNPARPTPSTGERVYPSWQFKWIKPKQIEAGEWIAPAEVGTTLGKRFADLHLILADLSFANECLIEADRLGLPDEANINSKSLIFSAVTAYGRCFNSGVRSTRLKPEEITKSGPFDGDIHEYLIALRNKHVAHSVNEFERCDAVACAAPIRIAPDDN